MITSPTLIVRVAAALLPRHSRDRYREQWLGELRDAPGVGIRASEIAIGSIAFAATLARPVPGRARVTIESVTRRSRLAVGLSLSAAIVAITQYAIVGTGDGRTGPDLYDSAVLTLSTYLAVYSILAPVVALVMVLATRGVTSRVRVGVALLVLASAVSALRDVINWQFLLDSGVPFISAANLVYLAAIALVIVAGSNLWREYRPLGPNPRPEPRSRSLLLSALGGFVVAAVFVLGFADASIVWAARAPLRFNLAFTDANRATFEDWLTLKVKFEDLVATMLSAWLIVGLVIACVLALSGFNRHSNPRRVKALSLAVVCLALLSYGAVVGFLKLAESSVAPTLPVDVVMLVARWGLVAIVLVLVGGVRGRDNFSSRQLGQAGMAEPGGAPAVPNSRP
ncbi:hypothetical protein [Lacisediminihabitans sp.]|jgi:hypothetical protein|uniref:hypothetical protein n=1 Tax=Lacisediminihabitans sp. TaxID=2787631 RepID=UPI002F95D55A